VEHKFQRELYQKYEYQESSSAKGIDFPALEVDMKVTSNNQPQSSCPYKSARQKVFGLGYNLLVFVYEKSDDESTRTARLNIVHTVFIEKQCTADFQMTTGLRTILDNGGNVDDLIAFMNDKMLPVDDIEANNIAEELVASGPQTIGYLTISNAL